MCVTIASVRSLVIEKCSWGRTTVAGKVFRDVILYPGGVEEWNWGNTNTHHEPGIRPEDVKYLLQYKPEFIILSQGFHKRLGIDFETYKLLLKIDVDFLVTDTDNAINRYNQQVAEQKRVAALIHSTC